MWKSSEARTGLLSTVKVSTRRFNHRGSSLNLVQGCLSILKVCKRRFYDRGSLLKLVQAFLSVGKG